MVPFICLAYAMLTELSLATNVKLAFGLTTGIAVIYPLNAKCAAPPGARRLETDIAPTPRFGYMTDGKLPVVYPMVSELLGQRNARGLTRPPARPTRPQKALRPRDPLHGAQHRRRLPPVHVRD